MKYNVDVFCGQGGREYNEDSVYTSQGSNKLIAVVADGLGGHGGGDIASKEVVDVLRTSLEPMCHISVEDVGEIFDQVNKSVLSIQTPQCKMKSTAAMLLCENEKILVAHLGDSRVYYFKNHHLKFQSIDHSVSQMAVRSGEIKVEEIRFHEDRNRLLRAMGSDETIKPSIFSLPFKIEHRDAFLLCSDGFWEYITEEEMEIDLVKSETPSEWLTYMLARIGEKIDGKNDNLSGVAIICEDGERL